jgi:hypothetical protein
MKLIFLDVEKDGVDGSIPTWRNKRVTAFAGGPY